MPAKTQSTRKTLPSPDHERDESSSNQNNAAPIPVDLRECWERLKHHHQAAGQAFLHTVICGVEIVKLKRLIRHGGFSVEARKHVPGLASRTVRRYRQIGEWYLSASHGRVVTVTALREEEAEPEDSVCRDEAISQYLQSCQINNADELQRNAFEKVPDLAKPRSSSKGSRVENLMQKVRRAWSRMSSEQRGHFVQCFEEFKAAKEMPVQRTGGLPLNSDSDAQNKADDSTTA